MSASHAVVRVLTGRLGGAELPVPPSGGMTIGHEYWNGLVIREDDARGVTLELERDENGIAHLTVLSGSVGLLGSTLEAGQRAVLPPFVPLMIGSHWLAWGAPDSPRWAEARALIEPPPAGSALPADRGRELLTAPMELGGDVMHTIRSWLTARRGAALLGCALLIAAAPAAGPAVRSLVLTGDRVTETRQALGQAGLPGLAVAGDPSDEDGLIVTGIVARESDRLKVQQVLADRGLAGTIAVQTSKELAAAAADVARIQGVSASARPIARTAVELHTEPLAEDRRAALEQTVKSDVSGLTQLVVRDDLPADPDTGPDTGPVHSIDDVTKRVATVVAGDPAYVKTADGAYYFAGAMMPTGHRLVSIEGHDVLLEKNGRQVRLTF